jgi:adenosylhomocysteine nucleosidase
MGKGVLVVACQIEVQRLKQNKALPVLITGIGKVNALYHLMDYLTRHKVDWVVNFGSAGSRKYPLEDLVDSTRFFQRDMDATPLNLKLGKTPYENKIPVVLNFDPYHFPVKYNALCASGDSVVSCKELPYDLVDMEAYALAKLCYWKKLPFISYKYITDSANDQVKDEWVSRVKRGGEKFQETYEQLLVL